LQIWWQLCHLSTDSQALTLMLVTQLQKKEFAPVHMNDMKKLKNYIFIYLFALKSFWKKRI
jgi:hypothetical protein